jgi:hypothetical protein
MNDPQCRYPKREKSLAEEVKVIIGINTGVWSFEIPRGAISMSQITTRSA